MIAVWVLNIAGLAVYLMATPSNRTLAPPRAFRSDWEAIKKAFGITLTPWQEQVAERVFADLPVVLSPLVPRGQAFMVGGLQPHLLVNGTPAKRATSVIEYPLHDFDHEAFKRTWLEIQGTKRAPTVAPPPAVYSHANHVRELAETRALHRASLDAWDVVS